MNKDLPKEVRRGGSIYISRIEGGFVAVDEEDKARAAMGMFEVVDKRGEVFFLCLLETGIGDLYNALDAMNIHFEQHAGRPLGTTGKLKVRKVVVE